MSEKLPPLLFQLPFIRCLVMGRASVAAFALLSGYVNSLGPIKRARSGNLEGALSGIAKSAFRRTGRFVIPAVLATTLSWLACQFGAYNVARVASSNWIRDTSPDPSPSFAAAFYDLFYSLGRTWLDGANQYDKIQWTLTFLLKGSMETYLTLFATVYVKPRWRMFILIGLYYFKWKLGDGEWWGRPWLKELQLTLSSGCWVQCLLGHPARWHLPRCRPPSCHSKTFLPSNLVLWNGNSPRIVFVLLSWGASWMERMVCRAWESRPVYLSSRSRICSILSGSWCQYIDIGRHVQQHCEKNSLQYIFHLDGQTEFRHLPSSRTFNTDCTRIRSLWVLYPTERGQRRKGERITARLATACEQMGLRVRNSAVLRFPVSGSQPVGRIRGPVLWTGNPVVRRPGLSRRLQGGSRKTSPVVMSRLWFQGIIPLYKTHHFLSCLKIINIILLGYLLRWSACFVF